MFYLKTIDWFRELCDEYKQKCYYPLYEIEDGYKANLVEIVEKTLLLQLDEIEFQPESDVDLHLEIGVGLDGAGKNSYMFRVSKIISKQCCQLYYWSNIFLNSVIVIMNY